jgi:FkbM family methyltransferase
MILHDAVIDRYISPDLATKGIFEPMETDFVLQEIRPGDVVLDIGANIGYYTLLFAKLVGPTGYVFAFEPDPKNFSLLSRNVELNGYHNVVLINKAVSDKTGFAKLFLSDINSGDHRIYDSADGRHSVPIQTVTLDDYFVQSKLQFDLVKFDIQGAEWAALQGMTNFLSQHERLKMIMEFWPVGLKRFGADAARFLAMLQEKGFRVFELDEARQVLSPTTSAKLLAAYTVESKSHTNLLCVKYDKAFASGTLSASSAAA